MSVLDSDIPFPKALEAPKGSVIIMDDPLISRAIAMSRQSPRRRIILPIHKSSGDPLQRMFNVLQPGSYIQPHRHLAPPKAESILTIRGSIAYFTFKNDGGVDDHSILSAGTARFGVDTSPDVYHTFFALEEDTVLFETKPGPFVESSEKDFAPWAPAEGSPDAIAYLQSLQELGPYKVAT
ncbi:MAG: WbuC family cupin fold metalloprotein [Desulfobacterales bacterium]|nr:MAG: WbuC family cupin fold metalloprotein [Desulfobacterales bacterium]